MSKAKPELQKTADLIAPMKALNELALSNAEKMIKLQTSSYEKYSTLALDTLQEATSVSDLESSRSFLTKQADVSKKVAADLTDEMKAYAELGNAYLKEIQKVMSDSLAKYGTAKVA